MMASKTKLSVLFIILLLAQSTTAQILKDWQWGDETEIYNDGITQVSISFFRAPTSCDNGGKSNRFRFNITGSLNPASKTTEIKLEYINCEGRTVGITETLNIGKTGQLGNVESIDYRFTGSAVLSVNNITVGPIGIRVSGPQSLCSGQSISLSSKLIGSNDSLSYQWQESSDNNKWKVIDSANAPIYNTPPISGKKYFRCVGVRTNDSAATKIFSNALVISVFSPAISILGNSHICSGGKVKFTAALSTNEIAGRYQWQKSTDNLKWSDLSGDTSSSYLTPKVTAELYFRCVFTPTATGCSPSFSNAIKSIILATPKVAITGEKNICEGASASLTANVMGENTGGYQWQMSNDNRNWNDLEGANANKFYSPPLNQASYFRAKYRLNEDGCLAVISNPMNITTLAAPPLSVSKSKVIKPGRRTVISAKALIKTADGHYHWLSSSNEYYGWSDVPGATDCKYKTAKVNSTMYYRCVYKSKDNQCEATSAIVTIGIKQNKNANATGKDAEKKWSDRYDNTKQFVQMGFGLGAEYCQNPFTSAHTNTQTGASSSVSTSDNQALNLNGLGLKGEFVIHPYIKDFFSVGLNVGGAVGTSPGAIHDVFSNTNSTGAILSESYLYSRLDFGGELAFGSAAFKLLFKYNTGIQTNDFSKSITTQTSNIFIPGNTTDQYSVNEQFRRETLSGGFRIGPYSATHVHIKRPVSLDLLYNLARDYSWNWQSAKWNYAPVSDWRMGIGLGLWVQSALKIGFDMNFDANSILATPGQPQSGTTIQVSLIYNRNWFH